MSVVHDFANWPRGPLHLAIGVFDGVHIGHQALIAAVAAQAKRESATPLAMTFDPLPVEVLAHSAPPSRLTDLDDRVALLHAAGAQTVAVLHFTREMSLLTPDEFGDRLASAGDLRRVAVGEDFRFGHGRAGDVAALRTIGARRGFSVDIARPVSAGGAVVSSTRVRNALLAGAVDEAATLLGRPYSVAGAVGAAESGRLLGYPTVDVAVPRERLLPRDGVYAVWANVGGSRVMAAANLGERHLEVFPLEGELAPGRVRVDFAKRIRDELRFESADAASRQIAKDVADTRRALG